MDVPRVLLRVVLRPLFKRFMWGLCPLGLPHMLTVAHRILTTPNLPCVNLEGTLNPFTGAGTSFKGAWDSPHMPFVVGLQNP